MRALHAALRRDLSRLRDAAAQLGNSPGRHPLYSRAGMPSALSSATTTRPRTTTCGRCCTGSSPIPAS
jgi:hypothetical protein